MTDTVDTATRSRMMAGIRSRNTQPEILVRKNLHRLGLRFSLNGAVLPGKPDLVLAKHQAAVFVHGCFWHAHSCREFKLPSSNKLHWHTKLQTNIKRDMRCVRELNHLGWRVLVIWECAVRLAKKQGSLAPYVTAHDWIVHYDEPYLEIRRGWKYGFSNRRSTARAF